VRDASSSALGDAVLAALHDDDFPLVVRPLDPLLADDPRAVANWFAAQQSVIERVLADYGAIMFRDFAIRSTADFAAVVEGYPSLPDGYVGGATPREVVAGRVFEATRLAASAPIVLHQEMAYLPRWPRKLAFYCHRAPDSGGETVLSSVRRFERGIEPRLRDAIAERGLLLMRNFRGGAEVPPGLEGVHRSWQEAFYTQHPAKAEADLAAMGLEHRWEDDGSLTTCFGAGGFVEHPVTGERHWFNSLIAHTLLPQTMGPTWQIYAETYRDGRPRPYEARFGDGGPIPLDDVVALCLVLDAKTITLPYRDGDVLMIDNILTFHGRNPYTGHRDVQVALLEQGSH
jgi:hypothetical protein